MKVYLLIESYGDLGDYHEYVYSIYLDKNKAESVKSELEYVSAKILKCAECVCSGFCIPDCDCELEDIDECDSKRIEYAKKYCDKAEPYVDKYKDGREFLNCHNKLDSYSDKCNYRIEEKEVIE